MFNVYEARKAGKEYCQTEGSDHYKVGTIEPLDLTISKGVAEGFCIGNIIKYAARYPETKNLDDLKKVADYAHILCGVELEKREEKLDITSFDSLEIEDTVSLVLPKPTCRNCLKRNSCDDFDYNYGCSVCCDWEGQYKGKLIYLKEYNKIRGDQDARSK